MVQEQIISKILISQNLEILEDNLITEEYFTEYGSEISFIFSHKKEYGNVPNKETFLKKFPDFDFIEVTESDKYLVDTLQEEYLYYRSVPIVQQIANLLKTNSNAAVEYMISAVRNLQPNYNLGGVNIISNAEERYEQHLDRLNNQDNWFFTTGFPELDDLIHGIQRGEELIVLFARINQGKSWISEKIITHVWQLGYNVGYISPEMSPISVGYRFDTLYKNFKNSDLLWGKQEVAGYKEYIEEIKSHKNDFIVATPNDFDRKITVSKLKKWIEKFKLDMIAIDGITYLTDERANRGDTKSSMLTDISEDLMSLSVELKIPVLVVVQANRGGVAHEEEDMPDLEHIKDSDGIGANASKVISVKQDHKNGTVILKIPKNRFGQVGGKLTYSWDINTGTFKFIPTYDDAESKERTEKKLQDVKKQYKDKEDVF